MRPIVADRVKETTLTTGTGTIALAGAASGFRSFAQAFASGQKLYYLIVDDPTNTTAYEVGIGTFTSGTPNTLSRDTVIESSNSNNLVNFSAGGTVIATPTARFLLTIIDALDSDIVTTGTSTAYAISTYRADATLYEGKFVCFKLHTTCGSSPTLNVDSAGAKALVDLTGTAIASGALISGAYYWCKYDATNTRWVVFSPFNYLSAASGAVGTTNLADGAVTLPKMANLAQSKLIGRATASTGVPEAVGLGQGLVMFGSNLQAQSASTSTAGIVKKATSAELAAETADRYPDAASLKYHPGVASAWAKFNGTASPITISGSHNVSSITDNGTGDYTVNFATAMANANYAPVLSCRWQDSDIYSAMLHQTEAPTTAGFRMQLRRMAGASGGSLDSSIVTAVVFGGLW